MYRAHKSKLWLLFLGTIFLQSYRASARNPFVFDEPMPQLRAIGMMEPQKKRFALITFKKKCYQLMIGDTFQGYLVNAIERNDVTLEDMKNKKALQLKIS